MVAIVVVDEKMGIGKNGQLLAHISGDLKYFKEKTIGKTIVFGRETLETFPGKKPLPGRKSIVLTTDKEYRTSCEVCCSIEQFLEETSDISGDELFVAGGASIYEQLLPYCDKILLTRIYKEFEADRFFPELDSSVWEEIWSSELFEEDGTEYRFFEYKRVR